MLSRTFYFAFVVALCLHVSAASNCASQTALQQQIILSGGATSAKGCQEMEGKPVPGGPLKPISAADVTFLLYTRKQRNKAVTLTVSNVKATIKKTTFSYSKATIFFVNGANNKHTAAIAPMTGKGGILDYENVNIIIVNWDSYANKDLMYTNIKTTPLLGDILAQFTLNLIATGYKAQLITFTGFSIGGQSIGLAAKQITKPSKIGKIIAADPQGNCYNGKPCSQRLCSTDALHVQIIHCTCGSYAMEPSITGTTTFYPDGGLLQTSCAGCDVDAVTKCSHHSCVNYLFQTMTTPNKYVGVLCDSWDNFIFGRCGCNTTSTMGYMNKPSPSGTFYFSTQSGIGKCTKSH